MPVSGITEGANAQVHIDARQTANPTGFSEALSSAIPESKNTAPQNTDQTNYIELGTISKETPTVSHLLKNHPEYSDKCWDIIFTVENQDKPFTKMQEGTIVALRSDNKELVWGKELSKLTMGVTDKASDAVVNSSQEKCPADKSIAIGTISSDNPTVSHLFQTNAHFDNRFWDIIHATVNSAKPFTSLMPGTNVVLDPWTMELSFNRNSPAKSEEQAAITIKQDDTDAYNIDTSSLADAVKPFIGTAYSEMDCYGLVVKGLMKQGVQYHGHGGLKEKLVNMASLMGLPSNAYLNGEGLVDKAGTRLFSKSILEIPNPTEQTEEIYSQIAPYLGIGHILSFSTPTRGHTGVISREGSEWTYINSGIIDNEISPGSVTKRVGEEFLKAEIKNWLTLAASGNEPLMVTLGRIEPKKQI